MKINLTSIESEKELHKLLASSLCFPDFYGNNWDAFWDSITGLVEMPKEAEFIGTAHIQETLPKAYGHLTQCLRDLNQEYPELECKVLWS